MSDTNENSYRLPTVMELEQSDEIKRLRADLEKARIQLAACGVIAMSNTPESAAKHRTFKPEYDCASLHDVIGAVDREMALRARVTELEAENAKLREAVTWRPIESAPKNGTQILTFYPAMSVTELTWWNGEKWVRFGGTAQPTHWLPLPEAPR